MSNNDIDRALAAPPKSAFRILVRHFFLELFHTDLVTTPEQLRTLITGILVAVGLIGILLPSIENHKYSVMHYMPPERAIPLIRIAGLADRLFLLCLAMVVVGFCTALEWDLLFPDERDYYILGALPVKMRDVFAAKIVALVGFVSLFIAVAAVPASFAMPTIMAGRYLVPPFGPMWTLAQAVSGILGGFFVMFTLVAVQGVLMQVLPPSLFRKASVWAQVVVLILLLVSLAVIVEVPNLHSFMDTRPGWALNAPPIWFLGLYERMLGNREPFVVELARRAWMATAASGGLMLLLYALSYRRHARRILESFEPRHAQGRRGWIEQILEGAFLRSPQEAGLFAFMCRTVARSRRHKLLLAGYIGSGFCIVLYGFLDLLIAPWLRHRAVNWNSMDGRQAILSIPLVLSFFVISGMRYVFSIPADLKANWLFQLTGTGNHLRLLGAARKTLIIWGIVPVLLVSEPVIAFMLGWVAALGQTIITTLLSLILIEILMRDFAKVPFTCSYMPGKQNPTITLTLYWGFFLIYAGVATAIEQSVLPHPVGFAIFVAVLGMILRFVRHRRVDEWENQKVIYEDNLEPTVRTLGLSSE